MRFAIQFAVVQPLGPGRGGVKGQLRGGGRQHGQVEGITAEAQAVAARRGVVMEGRVGEHRAVENMQMYCSPALATRSIAGVGITPPKLLGTPKPVSSVMISNTLSALCGGVIRGAQPSRASTAAPHP